MKTRTILALLFCGALLSCNAPQQGKQGAESTKTNNHMTNVELREKIGMVLDDMKAKAIEMGIQGVATAIRI